MQTEMNVKPFLRWAGGKTRLVSRLLQYVPEHDAYTRYVEPFLGSGALFFSLKPESAILGDMNAHLINCYKQIARNPNEVWNKLQQHIKNNTRDYYNSIRQNGLDNGSAVERAALFLYLNKTAFNGIFRVNKSGKFNVPYGKMASGDPAWPTLTNLKNVSICLKGATFVVGSFEETCKDVKKGDFVYLDPPYPPLRKSANFTHYTADGFGDEDHKRVAEVFRSLDKKGCLVMMSNSDQEKIRKLYGGFTLSSIEVTRLIGSNGNRFKVNELVVTNYPVLQQPQLL